MAQHTMTNYTYGAPPPIPSLNPSEPWFANTLAAVEGNLNHKFNHSALVMEALVGGKKEVWIGEKLVRQGSRRLACLGDTMLRSAFWDTNFAKDELLGTCVTCDEHDSIGSNQSLTRACVDRGIDGLIIGVDGWPARGPHSVTTMASTMEALIGAVWLETKDTEAVKSSIRLLLWNRQGLK